jgi:hypothetical protein
MAQREVLRARRRADRVGLHEAQPVEGAFQRGGREEAAGDSKAPQIVEGDRHPEVLGGRRLLEVVLLQAHIELLAREAQTFCGP